jgi:hypothetical protein
LDGDKEVSRTEGKSRKTSIEELREERRTRENREGEGAPRFGWKKRLFEIRGLCKRILL